MYPYQMYQQPQNNNQSNGYVIVRSEDEARGYPVAPGNSMTFFNETQPYCYKKTMSYSPLDPPVFEIYRIVKEETAQDTQKPAWKADITALYDEIETLRSEIQTLKTKPKREVVKDDTK